MSTNAMIWVKIKPSDFGRKISTNEYLLKNPIIENNYSGFQEFQIPQNPINDILYLGIYCHSDGYFEFVGDELLEKFNTYDEALNLVSLGDCSTIVDYLRPYKNWNNEEHKITFQMGCPPELSRYCYTYIFDEENFGWRVFEPTIVDEE